MVTADQIERAFMELDKVAKDLSDLAELLWGNNDCKMLNNAWMIHNCVGILKKALEEKES